MNRVAQLDAVVAQFDLNGHPFYQDWRTGELPKEMLSVYAAEYGRFIGTIAEGWQTIGFPEYAQEERFHESLWNDFAAEVGSVDRNLSATDTLVTAAKNLFSSKPEAAGALYAFEAQQPNTSRTKLKGLEAHYDVSSKGQEYFRIHADDFAEAQALRKVVGAMSESEFSRAKTACMVVCAAMWSALDGVYYSEGT